jgi:nickel/cobalt exporter
MNDTALATVAITGFAVAFLHAAIPTHWVPFVLVGKARGWSRMHTLAVTGAAGLGHVLLTGLIGLAIAWFGFELEESIGHLLPIVTAAVLLSVSAYFGWRQWRGKGVCHHHPPGSEHAPSAECGHAHEGAHNHTHWDEELKDTPLVKEDRGNWAAISGLFVMLTLSPCEGFLPIYLTGVQFGWRGFWVLSAILAVATLGGMTLFTWLTLVGMDRFRLDRFERYESGMLATLFLVLGLLAIVVQHGH